MDQNEVGKGMIYRHPWELSRTKMVINDWDRFIDRIRDGGQEPLRYVNVGAGDMYFDDIYLEKHGDTEVYAVDIGYDLGDTDIEDRGSKHLTRNIDNYTASGDILFDYSIMMDSLEYFPDDRAYITKLASRVKPGGLMFFSLPAYKKLFSDHDRHVGNLRRYDRAETLELLSGIEGLEVIYSRHFYFSLYLVRLFQVKFHTKIDPDRKITTGWMHSEKSLTTRIVKGILDLDYRFGKHLPGLSLTVVCKKK